MVVRVQYLTGVNYFAHWVSALFLGCFPSVSMADSQCQCIFWRCTCVHASVHALEVHCVQHSCLVLCAAVVVDDQRNALIRMTTQLFNFL